MQVELDASPILLAMLVVTSLLVSFYLSSGPAYSPICAHNAQGADKLVGWCGYILASDVLGERRTSDCLFVCVCVCVCVYMCGWVGDAALRDTAALLIKWSKGCG